MLRKIKIIQWEDKVPKQRLNPETKKLEFYDELQENNTLKMLNFLVNSMDKKNLPQGNIEQIRFWNRFEKAMNNAGFDSGKSNSGQDSEMDLKEFIYLDNEAWKIITEKSVIDLDARIGRNFEAFKALEFIFEAEEYDPNAEEKKKTSDKSKDEKLVEAQAVAKKIVNDVVESEQGYKITKEGKKVVKAIVDYVEKDLDPNAETNEEKDTKSYS